MKLATLLVRGNEIFAPVLNPFHGFAQVDGGKWGENFFWIEHHDFCPESAAYIGRDDANFVFGEVENCGQSVANRDWPLCGYPAGEHTFVRFPTCQNTPAFHWHRCSTLYAHGLVNDMWGVGEYGVWITHSLYKVSGNISWNVRVDQRGVVC